MNQEQIKLLSKMKEFVYEKKRRFIIREDRDYVADLLDFGLTEEAAWEEHILYLNKNLYFHDPKPNYSKEDELSLTFKKNINGKIAYIKIRLEANFQGMETVCLSFYEDGKLKLEGLK